MNGEPCFATLAPIGSETHFLVAAVVRPYSGNSDEPGIALAKTGIVVCISMNRNTVAIEWL
jgi:hypothetical protein